MKNKIEHFLIKLTEGAEIYKDDFSLMFTISDEVQLIFSRNESYDADYLDFVLMKGDSLSKKFEIDLKFSNIYDFLSQHLSKDHFLIKKYKDINHLSIKEDCYDIFISHLEKIKVPELRSHLLKTCLEVSTSDNKGFRKKQKI